MSMRLQHSYLSQIDLLFSSDQQHLRVNARIKIYEVIVTRPEAELNIRMNVVYLYYWLKEEAQNVFAQRAYNATVNFRHKLWNQIAFVELKGTALFGFVDNAKLELFFFKYAAI